MMVLLCSPLTIFSPCTIRYFQRRLKKSNHVLTSAAIRILVLTEAPALSYVQTPITSSTVHALWDITADFVKNEQQHLAESSCRKTEGTGPESINCLTQRLRPCTRSSVMPSLKKDSLGRLLNLSAVANRSTHVRATCNFNTEGLHYRDYFRAKLGDIDVMRLSFDGCKKIEFISIRGHNCTNCTAHFVQRDFWHAHTDSYNGPRKGCQCTSPSANAMRSRGGEDNFGYYRAVNPVHRCVSNDDSTTQWWFGGHC